CGRNSSDLALSNETMSVFRRPALRARDTGRSIFGAGSRSADRNLTWSASMLRPHRRMNLKSEIRMPKPERNPSAERRTRQSWVGHFVRISLFGVLSVFGFRISGFAVELPSGFVAETLATNLNCATAIATAPDGRIFIAEHPPTQS